MDGKSLGDRLKEAQTAIKDAAPAMKHGLEDTRAIKMKAEREVEAQEDKIQKMAVEVKEDHDPVRKATW